MNDQDLIDDYSYDAHVESELAKDNHLGYDQNPRTKIERIFEERLLYEQLDDIF